MSERRNFGKGTCPEPECRKVVNLTAEGKLRQHGKRNDPCPGSGQRSVEDAGGIGGPAPTAETVDNRPTAGEFQAAQELLRSDPGNAGAGAVVATATQYGVRPNPGPGEGAPGSPSEWSVYRVAEQRAARDAIGEPDGPGAGTVQWAEYEVLHVLEGTPAWDHRAVQVLAAANMPDLSVAAREKLQDARQAAFPGAPRDYNLDALMRRESPNPHRPALTPEEMRPHDGRTPEQQAEMDRRRANPVAHGLATLSEPHPAPSTLNPDVPRRGPQDHPFVAAPEDPGTNETAQDANPSIPVRTAAPLFVAAPAPKKATIKGDTPGVRPGPTDDDFDQWGRYKIPDPATGVASGRQRVTTFAKSISDQYGLGLWQQRKLVIGCAQNPQLTSQALGRVAGKKEPNGDVDVPFLDKLVDQLKEEAGAAEAAAHGTMVHTYTEHLDMGQMTEQEWNGADPAVQRDLSAYLARMEEYGLRALPDMVERTTIVRSIDVAGTLDRVLQLPNGDYVIGDVKTGQDLTYGQMDIEIQLACYAHGINENGVWDWGQRKWLPAPKVRTDFAVVMHVPAGGGVCHMLEMDLERGWANATLARRVVLARKGRNKVTHLDPRKLEAPRVVHSGPPVAPAVMDALAPAPTFVAAECGDHEYEWMDDGNGNSGSFCAWCGHPEPAVGPLGAGYGGGPVTEAVNAYWGPDRTRPDLFTPEQNARIDAAASAPMGLVAGGPTLPVLAPAAPDPLELLREYARQAMHRASNTGQMAQVYETAMAHIPPGDPVFAELAAIGAQVQKDQNVPF